MEDYTTELPTRQGNSFQVDKRGNLLVDLMIRSQLIAIGSGLSSGEMYSNVPYNSDPRHDKYYQKTSGKWKLALDKVPETDNYLHLGILCNKNMCLNENIKESCTKLHKTYFSLSNCGLHHSGIHAISEKHLYERQLRTAVQLRKREEN
jgi:hypothetical protein